MEENTEKMSEEDKKKKKEYIKEYLERKKKKTHTHTHRKNGSNNVLEGLVNLVREA